VARGGAGDGCLLLFDVPLFDLPFDYLRNPTRDGSVGGLSIISSRPSQCSEFPQA
jgi:hypothetical protein